MFVLLFLNQLKQAEDQISVHFVSSFRSLDNGHRKNISNKT